MAQHQEILLKALDGMGIACTPRQADLLLKHLTLVVDKNKDLNLTRITTIDDGIHLHIIDSLLSLPHLMTYGKGLNVLDLGTGGGFPGIPLAIMSNFQVTLLDSITKKVSTVDSFISQLGLSERCEAVCMRSEELAQTQAASFDVVIARAVAQTNVLIEYAAPLLKTDGVLCAMKARISDDEIDAAHRAADVCGMSIVSRETFELPESHGSREIIYIEKIAEPSIKLPRRNGMATKRPLGLK